MKNNVPGLQEHILTSLNQLINFQSGVFHSTGSY
jgi:hypothetical protein